MEICRSPFLRLRVPGTKVTAGAVDTVSVFPTIVDGGEDKLIIVIDSLRIGGSGRYCWEPGMSSYAHPGGLTHYQS